MSTASSRRSWIVPALFAIITIIGFIGGIAANVAAATLDANKYARWAWGMTIVAGLVTVAAAFWQWRKEDTSSPPVPKSVATQYNEQRKRYLSQLVDERRNLSLSLFDPRSANPNTAAQRKLQMADVYVDLFTKERTVRIGYEERNQAALAREHPLSAVEATVRYPHLILLGEPGGGKSTFLNHLAFCFAMNELEPSAAWDSKLAGLPAEWLRRLPVPIILRDMAAWLRNTKPQERKAGLLEAYLVYRLHNEGLSDFCPSLLEELREGSAFLLLDGLDEIPGNTPENALKLIQEMIIALPSAYPKLSAAVTCRVLSYQDPRWKLSGEKWKVVELERFNDQQIDHFIRTWYEQLVEIGEKEATDLDDLVASLSNAVRKPDLHRLAPNPLLLTAMANVHAYDLRLPDARVLLYERIVLLLMVQWDARRHGGDEQTTWRKLLDEVKLRDADVEDVLWELAYQAQEQTQSLVEDEADHERRNEVTADIEDATLWKALARLHPQQSIDWAKLLVEQMKLRAGLMVENPTGVFRFPHRTFQEYLSSCYLNRPPNAVNNLYQVAIRGVFWWETVIMSTGRWWYKFRDIYSPLALIGKLCPIETPTDDDLTGWRNIWLAGRCILEIGVELIERQGDHDGNILLERVRQRLLYLITHDLLSPRERAEAGSVLSGIGDPRNLDEMVEIPAGEFLMGSLDADSGAMEREKPRHKLFVNAFYIAKYPVTNGHYARFVEAVGHSPPSHWRGSKPPDELRNHPVVNVSWHDAIAYCLWLSQENKTKYRLPTEAEWEKAARGELARTYPWGNEFNSEYCNMEDTGIDGTSAVGIFAVGVSPYGIHDMSGNTWEWTSSLWGKDLYKPEFGYPYDSLDGRENLASQDVDRRVVRGGSFFNDHNTVRSAVRGRYDPDDAWEYYGFRVASSVVDL